MRGLQGSGVLPEVEKPGVTHTVGAVYKELGTPYEAPNMEHYSASPYASSSITGLDDSFDRNSVYRGSLTQRNPNGKNRRVERLFAVRGQAGSGTHPLVLPSNPQSPRRDRERAAHVTWGSMWGRGQQC